MTRWAAEVFMPLTDHDFRILHLATRDVEGRLSFYIGEDGSIALTAKGELNPVPAEGSLPKLEEMGLLSRELSRSYVLTPQGWDAVRSLL